MSLVRTERRGPAVLLAIHRADRRNALSRPLVAELTDAVRSALADPAARCLLLTGDGPAFCAGMDLAELEETLAADVRPEVVWDDANRLAALYELIYTSPKPTVAVVNGPAVAGGAGLVTVCDLAVAAPSARFGYPEVRRGLVAAMVLPHLLRHVGERAARHLLLTGELIDADTAVRVGLVNEVVPPERLLPRAEELARSLAEGGPEALAATKRLLAQFTPFARSVAEGAAESAAPRLGEECRAGLRAFFEKRPAPWSPG
jgi:methylglutaconyl-CoA hydratase